MQLKMHIYKQSLLVTTQIIMSRYLDYLDWVLTTKESFIRGVGTYFLATKGDSTTIFLMRMLRSGDWARYISAFLFSILFISAAFSSGRSEKHSDSSQARMKMIYDLGSTTYAAAPCS